GRPPVGRAVRGGGSGPLGTVAKSAAAPWKSTGSAAAAQGRRYTLLRQAQALLYNREIPAEKQHRTAWCHRSLRGESVAVYRSDRTARLAGLMTCGSVWTCPVCSARVTEARREELTTALGRWSERGGLAMLLTVTFPHPLDRFEWNDAPNPTPSVRLQRESDLLAGLVERFGKALRSWKGSRAYRAVMEQLKHAGSVRSLEVTVGDANGWHPHTHDLVLARRELTMFRPDAIDATARRLKVANTAANWLRIAAALRADPAAFELAITDDYRTLRDGWIAACLRVGLVMPSDLESMRLHALDVRGGAYAAEYIAKFGREAEGWSLASELTRPHSKIGGRRLTSPGEHYTPFQLLAASAEGDAWSGFRFRAFAEVFSGRRMLSWSRGLRRELLGDEEGASDDELAADDAPLPEQTLAGELTIEQYRALQARNMVGDFVEHVVAYQADQAAIDLYVADAVECIPPDWGDTLRRRRSYGGGFALMDA
ncbi:MAG: hypothetical protein ACOYLX_23255, partial [Burkholderiaceae bacterium]